MSSLYAESSPAILALLIGLVVIAAGFVGFVLIWWVKNVLRHKLPRPFLGDGSNVEWAEQMRAEIAASGYASDQDIFDTARQSEGKASGDEPVVDSIERTYSRNDNRSEKDSLESLSSVSEDDLLRSWLSDTGHSDDEWVAKLLGDRDPTKDS